MPLDRGEVALAVRVPTHDAGAGTEIGQVGAALNRMLEHVAAALNARHSSEMRVRRFVADASHELRTPLAAIRGYAELTRPRRRTLPGEVAQALDRIESAALRMTSLVDDLLLLARLDAGRPLDREPVDLTLLCLESIADARAAGPDQRWELVLPERPVIVVGDRLRLHQALANLLANARNHTPAGSRIRRSWPGCPVRPPPTPWPGPDRRPRPAPGPERRRSPTT
jgi:two-component system OmpR family sensor kinase